MTASRGSKLKGKPRGKPFKKGNKASGSRKGKPNKITVQLQDAIMTATEMSGRDGKGKDGAVGYLVWLSRKKPDVFGGLLGRLLPYQIKGTMTGNLNLELRDPAALTKAFQERGLPLPELVFASIRRPMKMIESVAREVIEETAREIIEHEIEEEGKKPNGSDE